MGAEDRPGPYVLGIAGSPRRHGNSERLLEACLFGVSDAGFATRTLVVAEAGIAPCRGCNACSLTGECVVRDGMQAAYPLFDEAAAVVISTPVFFATVPAVLKSFYDRLQPYWARTHVLGLPKPPPRQAVLLIARGGGDPYGYKCAETVTRSALASTGVRVTTVVPVEGVDSPSDIGRHPDALGLAREAGAALAAGL